MAARAKSSTGDGGGGGYQLQVLITWQRTQKPPGNVNAPHPPPHTHTTPPSSRTFSSNFQTGAYYCSSFNRLFRILSRNKKKKTFKKYLFFSHPAHSEINSIETLRQCTWKLERKKKTKRIEYLIKCPKRFNWIPPPLYKKSLKTKKKKTSAFIVHKVFKCSIKKPKKKNPPSFKNILNTINSKFFESIARAQHTLFVCFLFFSNLPPQSLIWSPVGTARSFHSVLLNENVYVNDKTISYIFNKCQSRTKITRFEYFTLYFNNISFAYWILHARRHR